MYLKRYLQLMLEKEASDLYMSANQRPALRIHGTTVPIGKEVLAPQVIADAAHEIMNERQRIELKKNLELDFGLMVDDVGRFRINAFNQRGTIGLVVRHVSPSVPKIRELMLPGVLQELAIKKRGLVMMAGPTGSGKSTTLAAMLAHRNEHMPGHILTIEDPIEFYHDPKRSVVNQRELGFDTHSYAKALRSAMREAPDVVMIGEARERQTMEAIIELAGTGHLTMSTVHANNAPQTLDRIVNMFPKEMHEHMLMDLSLNLLAIVSQRLVMSKTGKRVPACEVMLNTPYIAEMIRAGEIDKIKSAMEESQISGMADMDSALHALFRVDMIDKEEALANADSRANLEAKMNFAS